MTAEVQERISKKISDFLLSLRKEEGLITNLRSTTKVNGMHLDILLEEIETDDTRNDFLDIEYTKLSQRFGFTQNIVGMTFEHPRLTSVKITNIKPRNRKYPIIGYCKKDGKGYKFTKDQVKNYLGGDKLINRNANLDILLGKQ
jgi:hypothetical protein